ncbi:putative NBD/HSP70 family sugar kinase [Kribbella sp. VKM Ac-2571]|uniref:ROK family transcriptional regulator n=1 Tax=Kribbella sp. VKM Ac-2571 TaxID=2512222 RepID=UPI00105CD2CF|nr:ROK family transcriptional regulator [Kribbella sp. VKM Ac-2571]TDO54139.1 putative NBD/HSP70 family sugar kinase [Kribbella sp. VKM Ac-2571]
MTPVRRGQWQTAADVLTQLTRQPGITRAAVARALRLSTSSATEVTARLRDVHLLTEVPAPSQGRGRPTTVLQPHPQGPVVLVLDLRQSSWRSAVVALDGSLQEPQYRRHRSRRAQVVLNNLRREVEQAQQRYGARLQMVSLAVPGTVRDNHLMQAPTLEWVELDLAQVTGDTGVPLLAGNDATLSGVAEARTGAAAGAGTAVHLIIEVGIGGTLLIDGVPAQGASGAGGEYGHMPFGDRSRECPCGARGCWDLEIDGRALARYLKQPTPDDPVAYTEEVLRRSDRAARAAVTRVVASLGYGIAGLVNAHDPDVVTIGGLAIPLRAAAEETFAEAYESGLMTFHRAAPPPVLPATHQPDGPLRGAAALALDQLTSEQAIAAWVAQR